MMKRIGIYPGTFDPVHNGHIAFALAGQEVCDLDQVVLLPEHEPRGKHHVTAFDHRVAMLQLATKPYVQISVLQLNERQFSIAATLPELQQGFPDAKLVLLLGSDVAMGLGEWPDIGKLLEGVELAVGVRKDDDTTNLRLILDNLQATYKLINAPSPHVASSQVRARQHENLDPAVAHYISQHSLYNV